MLENCQFQSPRRGSTLDRAALLVARPADDRTPSRTSGAAKTLSKAIVMDQAASPGVPVRCLTGMIASRGDASAH